MSLDGKIATVTGASHWISSPQARRWSLALREEHDAILVGSGTILADDPRLDRRLKLAAGPDLRIVLDRRLRTPPEATLFKVPGPVLIYTESTDREASRRPRGARGRGGPTGGRRARSRPRRSLPARRAQRAGGGGGEIHASFVAAGLYDQVRVDCAPLLIGGKGAPAPLGGLGVETLDAAPRLEDLEVRRRGGDLLLTGYRKGCLPALLSSVAA